VSHRVHGCSLNYQSRSTTRQKTILIVDDNADVRELLAAVLSDAGYTIREAENGQEALELLETLQPLPALMVLDLMMPVMTGGELLDILADRDGLSELPVILISAGGEPGVHSRTFLRKPVDPRLLVRIVGDLCRSP
jgi:CheY-like chemotaxis protein